MVKGKRADLTALLMSKIQDALLPEAIRTPQLFQGHTRFATSSISTLPGCHPHQWCERAQQLVWEQDAENGKWVAFHRNTECYITHNGDLDYFKLHGTQYPLEDVQTLLVAMLH